MVTMFENRGKNSHYFVIARAQKKSLFWYFKSISLRTQSQRWDIFYVFQTVCSLLSLTNNLIFQLSFELPPVVFGIFFLPRMKRLLLCSLTVVFFQQTLHKNKPRPHLFLGAPWGVQQRESILTTMVSMVVSMTDFGRFTTWFFLAPKHKSFWILRSIVKSYLTRRRGETEYSQWFKNHSNCIITVFIQITSSHFLFINFTLEL